MGERENGPILRTRRGARMDRHCATRRLHRLADTGGVHAALIHPHMLRHTFVTAMLDARVDLRDVQIAAMRANPKNVRYTDLHTVCEQYFGPPRTTGGSHAVFRTPCPGDPRVNIQKDHGLAKAHQVRQVIAAIEKKEDH
ncbi:MAG: tyrosine-type recombinase/integrase [Ornithinibacter sp.]